MSDQLKEKVETFAGGGLGIIAIIAAIMEFRLVDNGALAGCIKDVAGTLLVVILLLASIKIKPHDLVGKLKKAVEMWGEGNAPLIFQTEGYVKAQNSEYSQGFVLLQNPRNYVSLSNSDLKKDSPDWHRYAQYGNGKLTGKFLDMPSYKEMTKADFAVLVVMEQSHFTKMPEIEAIIESLVSAVNSKHVGGMSAGRVGKSHQIKLQYKRIETNQDIEHFVEGLNFVLSLVKVVA